MPGTSSTMRCYYEAGADYRPTKIKVMDFTYSGSLTFAILLPNPSAAARWVSINLFAFGGTRGADSVFGNKYMGRWFFPDMFKTVTAT